MKNIKRIGAGLLAATMIFTQGALVFAEGKDYKEEVVYINTNQNGGIEDINVVNIFPKSEVEDFGDYKSVKILNSSLKPVVDGDKIQFTSDKDRIYYQGELKSKEAPWKIDIKYFLDGKEIDPADLAGASGQVKIDLSIKENKKVRSDFYDKYVLQISTKLDTNKFKNIEATKATLANEGENKVLTFLVLPKTDFHTSILADVEDFEFAGFSINGLELNVDIDSEELGFKNDFDKFKDAVFKINDGANQLKNNGDKLIHAAEELKGGVHAYVDGTGMIVGAIEKLNEGSEKISTGAKSLDEKSGDLIKASEEFYQALRQISEATSAMANMPENIKDLAGATGKIEGGMQELSQGSKKFSAATSFEAYSAAMAQNGLDISSLEANYKNELAKLIEQIKRGQEQLQNPKLSDDQRQIIMSQVKAAEDASKMIQANLGLIAGTRAYFDGLQTSYKSLDENIDKVAMGMGQVNKNLQGFEKLAGQANNEGANILNQALITLTEKYGLIHQCLEAYTDGVGSLAAGLGELKAGLDELTNKSKDLNEGGLNLQDGSDEFYKGLNEYMNGVLKLKDGTNKFYKESLNIDEEIKNKIREKLPAEDHEALSFASEKNKNVRSVQFIIQSQKIEKLEKTVKIEEDPVQKENFFERLTDLFKR